MCRHLAYLGPPTSLAELVVAPSHGLYEQSWAPRLQTHGVVNADGFGLGWYPAGDEEPARYRRAVPIWADPNLPELARAIRSTAVLAAVRSATLGTGQEETACAPFRFGRFLFSHNGAIPDWADLPADLGPDTGLAQADLLKLEARCDSALLWALICSRLRRGDPPDTALAAVVRDVAAVRPTARLNLLLTDGAAIFAVRHGDTLWHRSGAESVIVASEPDDQVGLVGQEGQDDRDPDAWHKVPDHSLLTADLAGGVRTTPITSTTSITSSPSSTTLESAV